MVSIVFTDWKSGFQKVAFNRLLRQQTGMSLSDAKRVVDELLAENRVEVVVESEVAAETIRGKSLELGIGGVTLGGSTEVPVTHVGSPGSSP